MSVITGTENFTNGPLETPDAKEEGNDVFDKLEEFMERVGAHTHDGTDSTVITLNIEKGVQELAANGNGVIGGDFTWGPTSPGKFRALVDVAPSSDFDNNERIYFYRIGSGAPKQFYPTVERVSPTQYYVYSNVTEVDNGVTIDNINLKIVTVL